MPDVAVHPDTTIMNPAQQQQSQQQQQQQPQSRPPLRRAVYVHVSDLTTSAYNIDHKKLEEELARVQTSKQPAKSAKQHQPLPTDEETVAAPPQKRLQPPRGGFNLCV